MREEEAEEPDWFARWEEELPTPEELMPLSQTLITPHLALAFDIVPNHSNPIPNPNPNPNSSLNHNHHLHLGNHLHHQQQHQQLPPFPASDFDSGDLGSSGGGGGGASGGDEPARTLKRPRLVWTPQLHKRFVDAVAHLGIKNAVPKTIMQLMSVDGLTRENVASHLQKYRLYLKRMQGLASSGGGGPGGGGPVSAADAATDQLFASGPLPHHFLRAGGGAPGVGPEPPPPYVPYVPMAALQHHHQQMAAAAAAQQQFYHQRQMGFDHGFLSRAPLPAQQPGLHRMGPAGLHGIRQGVDPAVDDSEERGGGGRRVLTLFPTGDD